MFLVVILFVCFNLTYHFIAHLAFHLTLFQFVCFLLASLLAGAGTLMCSSLFSESDSVMFVRPDMFPFQHSLMESYVSLVM